MSNSRGNEVGNGASGGAEANEFGRTDFNIMHMTIKALDAYPAPDGASCFQYPNNWTVGTKFARTSQWVGGAYSNNNIAGAEYIGCSNSPQKDHRAWYDAPNGTFARTNNNAARISLGGDLGPLWATADSGFSTFMELHYASKRGNGIWVCGTNYYVPGRRGACRKSLVTSDATRPPNCWRSS